MKDRVFLDSNVIIYSLGMDPVKKKVSVDLLKKSPYISIQVVNEVVNISLKKLKMPNTDAYQIGSMLLKKCKAAALTESIVLKGF